MLKSICMIIFTVVIFSQVNLLKASSGQEPLNVPQLQGHIKIDGKLDEENWKNALKLELPFETEPGENIPAPLKTEVYVFYNQSHLYFGLMCYDPDPSEIRARYTMRDQIETDDKIYINLDTFNDQRQNYFLGCNPLGVQQDGTEGQHPSPSWDTIWDARGQITDKGYIIEIAIPFSALQFQRKKGPQIWGLDISRSYPRDYRRRFGLVKMDRNNNSYQSQFLKITGFDDIKPGKNIEIIPTLTGVKTDNRVPFPKGSFDSEPFKLDPGITAKWGVTNNLTLNGTVNPDFSQVEADSQKLDVNQPFALFYEEKRPFFTEGSDFFTTPYSIVHTRAMRDPRWGLKLSGKEGNNTIGLYFVRDNITNIIFPGSQGSNQTSLNLHSTAVILRYKRDLGTKYTLGALITNREGGDYFNRVYGIDGQARINRKNKIDFQLLGAFTHYPTATAYKYSQPQKTLSDKALFLSYAFNSRNVNANVYYEDVGTDFRADLGFMPMVDFRAYGGEINYTWYKFDSWWSTIQAGLDVGYTKDQHGKFLGEKEELGLGFRGIMQSHMILSGARSREAYHGRIYNLLSGNWNLNFLPHRSFQVTLNGIFGDRIDYDNSRKGKRFQIDGTILCNIGKHFNINMAHNFEKMTVNTRLLYTANITQGTLIYHLNTRIFFRAITQYIYYKYNVFNYSYEMPPRFSGLFNQFLFSYRVNPRTVLFLGYNDNYEQPKGFPLTQKSRTFFLKISYSLQL